MTREYRMDKGHRGTFLPPPILDANASLWAITQFGVAYAI
jgi:hypothetical protein